jgi:hypothetical protein
MKIERGTVRVSLWPTRNDGRPHYPRERMMDRIAEIEHVEEMHSYGLGPFGIIVSFDSFEEMQGKLPGVEARILAALEGRTAPADSADCAEQGAT